MRRLGHGSEPYLVVASHHPSWCLVNTYREGDGPERVLADEVLRVLLDEPRVIAWMAGHVHRHSVVHHRRGDRLLPEITSASLIDWPQQWRTLEIVQEPDATLALVSTAVDHAGTVAPGLVGSADPFDLAGLSRLLACHVPDVRRFLARPADEGLGGHERNTVVRVPDSAGAG